MSQLHDVRQLRSTAAATVMHGSALVLPGEVNSCISSCVCRQRYLWIVRPDLPGVQGALTACRKALKPDGLLLGALLGGDSLQVLPPSVVLRF